MCRSLARREGEHLVLQVSDDGVGLQAAAQAPSKGQGIGLANVRDRLAGLYGESARLSVQQRGEGGVSARIELPWAVTRDGNRMRHSWQRAAPNRPASPGIGRDPSTRGR